jgi:hypothetical protein
MSTSVLFVSLSKEKNTEQLVPMAAFRAALATVGVVVPHLHEGSNSWDFASSPGSALVIHEMGHVHVKNGSVSSFGIERPCSPSGPELWFALLRCGFVMLPSDGPAFATREKLREVPYLREPSFSPYGVVAVDSPAHFGRGGFVPASGHAPAGLPGA